MNNNPKPFAMIVEDDPDAAAIFSEALKAAQFDTEIIGTGDQALERLGVKEPDMVILDMHLPNVAGPEILVHIRAQERLAETKVIVATADPSMAEDLEAQADLVLLKPISFSQLRDLAKRLRNAP